ncbi:MAG: 50S ribosomal protein L11 methyltransferase [Wenzhouxiangella sp.]
MTEAIQATDWLSLDLKVPAAQAESVEAALFEAGAVSVTLLDAADHPLHEPAPGELPLWPELIVQGLFPGTSDPVQVATELRRLGLIDSQAGLTLTGIAERDWQRAWMDQYQPMRFGQDLWICPSHIEPDPAWPLVVRLDPGLAFGSGTHPTTALCLEWIDGLSLTNQTVIDYGCGSGVLAIAAALKGATRVVAVDYDPQALTATRDNAERNAVADRIQTFSPEQFVAQPDSERTAGLVLANILAQPLIELAPMLSACVRPGGELVLSGILPEQAAAVAEAYQGLDPGYASARREDWMRLVFRRR